MSEAAVKTIAKPELKETRKLELTIPQREFLVTNFKDEFEGVEVSPGQRLFRRLGPTIQAMARDVIQFHFKYSPITAEVSKEKIDEKTTREFYKFTLTLAVPMIGHEITLTREIAKDVLERQ